MKNMKNKFKFLILTLLILLAQNSLSSEPVFKKGDADNSVVAGVDNKTSVPYSYAFGQDNKANADRSSAFGFNNEANGGYSSAFGNGNKATYFNSSAFGYGNIANGIYSSSFGYNNKAVGNNSSAFGFNNEASGARSGAFGLDNKTEGNDSFAFGRGNQAKETDTFAFGYVNKANAKNSFAFGNNNETSGENASAFGFDNRSSGENSSAFGFGNKSSGENSSAFGYEVSVSGEGSGAFGRGEYDLDDNEYKYDIKGNNSWAIGSYNNIAAGTENNFILGNNISIGSGISNSVVLGNNSVIKESNTVSIGSENEKRRIVFVADGTKDTDAATIGQVRSNFAKKDGSNLTNTDVTAWKAKLGVGSGSQSGTSVDAYTKTESDNKFAEKSNVYNKTESDNKYLNKTAYDTDKATFAAKAELNSKADKNNVYTKTDSDARFAIKTDLESKINKDASNLSSTDVAAWKAKLGVNSNPQSGTSVDAYTKTESDNKYLNKTAYDTDKATFATKTELNSKANKTDVYTKTESNNKFAEKSNVYSKVESDNKYLNKITYDTDKATFATKTELNDKANKADVYTKVEADDKLNTKAKKDGSNLSASDIATWKAKLATGSVSSIANTAGGTESTGLGYGNVVTGNYSTAVGYKNNVSGSNSGAFGDPNTITGNRSYAVGNDNNIAGDDNFVLGSNVNIGAGISNSVALGNNSTVSSSNEVSVGSAGKERKITNVADGVISATSTDAVNGKQLYQVANSVSTGKTDILRKEFIRENEKIKNEVRQVGSLSAALSALHPLQFDKNKPNQIMAGFGQYRDKSAVAVGMAHYFTENLMMTGGVSLSEGNNTKAMANVGLTWKFGKGGSESTNAPNYVVQNEISRLAKENNEQKDLIHQQNLKLQSQDERIKNLENKLELLLKTK